MTSRFVPLCGSILALTAAVSWSVTAQTPAAQPAAPPIRVLVVTTVVKPEMGAAWRALVQNEAVPANKKAGVPWRWVFQSGPLSGMGNTYITVSPITNFAQFDGPPAIQRTLGADGFAKYVAKVQPMVVSTHNVVQTLAQGASLQSYSSTLPALARVTDFQVLSGRQNDFNTLIREQYMPAMKKAGVRDYLLFNINYGAPAGQRSIVEYLANYAELDQPQNPLVRAIGQEAAGKLNQQRAALISNAQSAVYRLVPELSYGTATPPKK